MKKVVALSKNGNLNRNNFLSKSRVKKNIAAMINKKAERNLKAEKSFIVCARSDDKKPIKE